MSYLSIRNWSQYQHYKKRHPPWVKFYTSLLDDEDLRALPLETQLLWDRLLLLAARKRNAIPREPEAIAKLTGIPTRECREGIDLLVQGRWLRETQTMRRASAPASNGAMPRENRKEKEIPPKSPMPRTAALNAGGCTHDRCRDLAKCYYE